MAITLEIDYKRPIIHWLCQKSAFARWLWPRMGKYTRDITLPTEWHEISLTHAKDIYKLRVKHAIVQTNSDDYHQLQVQDQCRRLLYRWARVSLRVFKQFDPVRLQEVYEHIAKFVDPRHQPTMPNMPSLHLRLGLRKLYTTVGGYGDFTFTEHQHWDTFLHHYHTTDNTEYLYKALAVLYRPRRQHYNRRNPEHLADPRQAYNLTAANRYYHSFKRLPQRTLHLIMWNIAHAMQHYQTRFTEVYGTKESGTAMQWDELLAAYAGNLGEVDKIKAMAYYDVLIYINEQIKRFPKK